MLLSNGEAAVSATISSAGSRSSRYIYMKAVVPEIKSDSVENGFMDLRVAERLLRVAESLSTA
jgi:hypothetical protein